MKQVHVVIMRTFLVKTKWYYVDENLKAFLDLDGANNYILLLKEKQKILKNDDTEYFVTPLELEPFDTSIQEILNFL